MSKLRVDKIAAPIIKDEFTGSVYFDGTGDYLSVADSSDFTFGTEDFTIEFWRYRSSVSDTESYVTKYNNTSAQQSFWFGALSNGREDFAWYSGSSGYSIISANNVAQVDEWGHLAAVRLNGVITLYLNGVSIGSDSSSDAAASFNDDSNPLIIGGDNYSGSTYDYHGYISNLRICKGHAVYTENFTPPTRELEVHTGAKGVVFPAADNRTVLLACQDAYNPLTEATGRHKITGAGALGGVPGQNLVTNGQFSDGYNGWSQVSSPATFEVTGGRLHVVANSNGDGAEQNVSLVVGVTYILKFDYEISTSSIYDGNGIQWATPYGGLVTGSGTIEYTFTATTISNDIEFIEGGGSDNADFYIDNVSLVAVHPVTDANPGLLRKTNITSTITETTGSVYFDGTGDYIKSSIDSEDFAFSGDFAMECWVQKSGNGAHADGIGNVIMMTGNTNNRNGLWISVTNAGSLVGKVAYDTSSWALEISGGTLSNSVWHHVALTRSGSTVRLFLDGVQQASGSNSTDITTTYSNAFSVGGQFNPAGSRHVNGYVSNARICKGHAVYTSNFIPPTRELEVHEGPDDDRTVLLACYDGENIFAEKTGRHIIAAYGDRTSSPTPTATDSPIGSTTVTPGLTREVDPVEGPTFGGGVGFASQNWLTLPKGTTAERMPSFGRDQSDTRGFFAGAYSPTRSDVINYVTVPTLGNAIDFGNLGAPNGGAAGFSDSTRGWIAGGNIAPTRTNVMEYVTMASSGNAVDGGDLITATQSKPGSVANSIRGIVAGGATPGQVKTIVHHTIQTTGIVQNFGDLTEAKQQLAGVMSPTRGVFAGGKTPSLVDTIEYVTMASTGNAVLFGELSLDDRAQMGGASNTVRGLFGGGRTPSALNHIEYITMATLGDAVDFGDLTQSQMTGDVGAVSNSTRVVFGGGGSDELGHVEIATLGNTTQFGKFTVQTTANQDPACFSSGHGGLG